MSLGKSSSYSESLNYMPIPINFLLTRTNKLKIVIDAGCLSEQRLSYNDFTIDDFGWLLTIYLIQRKQKKSPYCYIDNKDSLKKGGLLLSHIALQYHRRKRA